MTTVVTDDVTGVEVNIGPSEICPDRLNVTIFGPTCEAVQSVIFDLAEEYANVTFFSPSQIGAERWGAMGRVW